MSNPTTGAARREALARVWTAGEDDMLRALAAQGLGAKRIARKIGGRSHYAVCSRMTKLGISSYRAPKPDEVTAPPAPVQVEPHPATVASEHLRDRPLKPAIQARAIGGRVWRAA